MTRHPGPPPFDDACLLSWVPQALICLACGTPQVAVYPRGLTQVECVRCHLWIVLPPRQVM